jgi:hypothetical protein
MKRRSGLTQFSSHRDPDKPVQQRFRPADPLPVLTRQRACDYQIASITALVLLVPSVGFMRVTERFLKADVLAKFGS